VRLLPLTDDLDLLSPFVVYPDIVPVLHFEKNVLPVRKLRPGNQKAFVGLACLGGDYEQVSNLGARPL